MIESVNFREPVRGDLEVILDMLSDLSPFQPLAENREEIFSNFLADLRSVPIVATLAGEVVGYGVLNVELKIRGGLLGHIEDIVTRRDHRGRGIGRMLLAEITSTAFDLGCYRLSLTCLPETTSFYEKSGFVVHGTSMKKMSKRWAAPLVG